MAQYKDVTWVDGQGVDTDTLGQMADNDRYLYDHMPVLRYGAFGITKNTGVKVASGIAVVGPSNQKIRVVPIRFGNYFTPGCKPVVTLTLAGQFYTYVTLRGLAQHSISVDHTGFAALIETTAASQGGTYHIHWIAVGY